MSCPTVIRVSTKTGPPGIGLPAGSAQQNGFAIVKDGATPYLYKLVEISQIGLPQAIGITASPTFAGLTLSGLQAQAQGLAIVGINGQIQRVSIGSGLAIQNGALVVTVSSGGSGTVTSVGLSAPTGFSVSNSPVTGSGVLSFSFADGYSLLTTAKQQQWDAAAVLVATAVQGDDARLTNSREWSADTISQAEVEEGSSTTRRAFNSLRARQGVLAWWQSTSGSVGKLLAAASTQVDARAALGLGTAATSAASDFATPSALATGLAGKADLIGGVIPSSQIPSIAITDYLGAVNSQSAMLALNGQKGDWCIRTDGLPNTGAWILSGNNPGSLSDWVKIPLPDVPVQSVNGQAGNIVLGPGDIGAATAAQGAKADSAIQPGNPALSDAREWNATTIDEAEAAAGTATTRRAFNALRVRQAILGWWNNSSDKVKLDGIATGATANAGTVTSVGIIPPTGLTASAAITTSGNITLSLDTGYSIPTTASQALWNTAYSERSQWDGGSTGLNQATARTSLGLNQVAWTGNYGDLANRPDLSIYATSSSIATSLAGKADLDGTGKVPAAQLPSYVDDVLEFATLASFPATGETGKLYVSLATNRQYRWSGSVYIEINPSPGSTDAVPEGSINLYFTNSRGQTAAADWWSTSSSKTKLDGIATGATANASDADLRDRSTHTGLQAISTITGLQTALNAVPAANTLNANLQQVLALTGQELGALAQSAPRAVVWNAVTNRLEFSPTISLPAQTAAPATPSSGFTVYADNSGRFSWVGTNGFSRTFDATGITAPRIWVPPDRSGTLALTEEYTAHIFGTDTENLAVGRVRLLARAWQETTQFVSLPLWELVTAPSGASAVFDIRVNGTSIYSTLPSIASGSTSSSANPGVFSTAFNTANRTIASGSLVEVWCTQTGVSPNLGAGLRSQWYTQRIG